MFKSFILFLITTVLIFAEMFNGKYFVSKQQFITYPKIQQTKSACVSYPWNDKFCSKYTLNVPYTKHLNKDIKYILDKEIDDLYNWYNSPLQDQEYILDELNVDSNDSGHFNWSKTIDIFAFTPRTVTIQIEESRYTGGAHGSYDISYTDYDLKTHSMLGLKDIIKPGSYAEFEKIAQQIYRQTYQMPQDVNMTYDGWFEPEFRLAANMTITAKGLYFLYNSYEIKAYADGQTPLLIPYKAIKHLLNPKIFDDDFFNKLYIQNHTIKKIFEKSLTLEISPVGTDKLKFTIKAINDTYFKTKGWLSITFVGLNDVITSHIKSDFTRVNRYPNGIAIYHKPTKKTIKKHSVLLEATQDNWDNTENNTKTLSFVIKKPKNRSKLTILLRLVLKNKVHEKYFSDFSYYPYEKHTIGEQGYQNYKVEIDLD
jgi:hypothetical protein